MVVDPIDTVAVVAAAAVEMDAIDDDAEDCRAGSQRRKLHLYLNFPSRLILILLFTDLSHSNFSNDQSSCFKSKNDDVDNFLSKKSEITGKIYDIISKLDGSFSAEHGIGILKKSELRLYKSDSEIKLMEQIKNTLDPNNIMNPGKVL